MIFQGYVEFKNFELGVLFHSRLSGRDKDGGHVSHRTRAGERCYREVVESRVGRRRDRKGDRYVNDGGGHDSSPVSNGPSPRT